MASEKNIKDMNRKYLIGYLLLNFAIFAWLSGTFDLNLSDLESLFKKITNPSHLFGILFIPLSLVLEGIISSDFKAKLVFMRPEDPLPGCRAFSEIAPKDYRIDMKQLERLFPSALSATSKEQNSIWFQMYKRHSSDTTVFAAHKAFLITRDMASLTAIFIPIICLSHIMCSTNPRFILFHLGVLVLILIAFIVASRNYGYGLVANVIVEELSRTETNKNASH